MKFCGKSYLTRGDSVDGLINDNESDETGETVENGKA